MEDYLSDQITMREYIDPFTGEPVNQNKKKKRFSVSWEQYAIDIMFNATIVIAGNSPL